VSDDLEFHHVDHFDRWKLSARVVHRANPYRDFHETWVRPRDFVPPVLGTLYRYVKRFIARRRL
jgi:hypothetical protein